MLLAINRFSMLFPFGEYAQLVDFYLVNIVSNNYVTSLSQQIRLWIGNASGFRDHSWRLALVFSWINGHEQVRIYQLTTKLLVLLGCNWYLTHQWSELHNCTTNDNWNFMFIYRPVKWDENFHSMKCMTELTIWSYPLKMVFERNHYERASGSRFL